MQLEIVIGAPALILNIEVCQSHNKYLPSRWNNNLKHTLIDYKQSR